MPSRNGGTLLLLFDKPFTRNGGLFCFPLEVTKGAIWPITTTTRRSSIPMLILNRRSEREGRGEFRLFFGCRGDSTFHGRESLLMSCLIVVLRSDTQISIFLRLIAFA